MGTPPKYCCEQHLYYPTLSAVSVATPLNSAQSKRSTEKHRLQAFSPTFLHQEMPRKAILQNDQPLSPWL